jgi:hypothetical protein
MMPGQDSQPTTIQATKPSRWWVLWPWSIPLLYFAVLVFLQPTDRIVMPWKAEEIGYPLPPHLSRWLTDDCDTVAFAMRGWNANLGRQAGLTGVAWVDSTTGWFTSPKNPDAVQRERAIEPASVAVEQFDRVVEQTTEWRDRYFLEYPPAALWLFRLGLVGTDAKSLHVSPALLDSHQTNVGSYAPKTADERTLFRSFRRAMVIYTAIGLLALMMCMWLVAHGVDAARSLRAPAWLLILPGMLYFAACRFDILPAGLVLCSIALADRRRVALAGCCLGMAVALKMYPLALAPILLRYAAPRWKDALVWCVAAAVPLVLSYGSLFLTDGLPGITVPLQFQLGRNPEPDWCFFSRLLPMSLAEKSTFGTLSRILPVLGLALLCSVKRPADCASVLRRCAMVLLVFLTTQTFYSPQWWQWLALLIIPLVRQHPWLVGWIVFHDPWTYLHFPILFDMNVFSDTVWDSQYWMVSVHVWTRGLLWFGLFLAMMYQEQEADAKADQVT